MLARICPCLLCSAQRRGETEQDLLSYLIR